MEAGNSPSSRTLACSGCSAYFQSNTTSPSQFDRDLVAPLCATCTILQRCRTNRVPTKGGEWAQIDALVEDARSDLTRLNQQRSQRSQARASLKKRSDLQRLIDNAHSLTAPIRMVPPEVLNEIFEALCTSSNSLSISRCGLITTQTLDLSQVSAFWRAAILSRPALWSALLIDLRRVSTNEMSQLVSYYIQSSRPWPLKLMISMRADNAESLSTQAYNLFKNLFAESGRWHNVWINTTQRVMSSLSPILAVQPRMNFPMLTNLDWFWASDEPEDYHLDLYSLADFPKLRICSLNSFSPARLESIRMPNLIKLVLFSHFEHHPLAALLQLFPNLHECEIIGLEEEERPRLLADIPPHSHLRSLNLNVCQTLASLGPYLHSLSLPSLKSFSLSCHPFVNVGHMPGPLPSTGLLQMLDRSSINLTHLTLLDLEEPKIIQILDRLPSLITVSLQGVDDFSSALFKRLALNSDMPNLAPQLRSLDLVCYGMGSNGNSAWFMRLEKSTLDCLCDMVESRCRSSISRLETLSLSTGSNSSPTPLISLRSNHRLRKRLQPLVEAGLSLKLINKNSN